MNDQSASTSELEQPGPDAAYQVLARKYRPSTFDELVGQEAMVQTLTNAIDQNRLAHAFVLTGVRGIGKTTTARIIARALNCVGPDGTGGPTIRPCGVCDNCKSIAADRHVDVLEMDAASRTGVDDIREIIEGVRYKPTSARFKVYIIDEVHMLSRNAFNALLKTLEEPPEHVKFIFATTEIRKVPVTVLSRCQRFDLRRVGADELAAHFSRIAEKEAAKITAPALHLIGRAADGSVRDGLSLLDQAIAMSTGEVDEDIVREMLGLADRSQSFDLLEAVFKGDAARAISQLATMYKGGADPSAILDDLLEITHFLTRIKVVPQAAETPDVPEIERTKGKTMCDGLAMSHLSRAWQMLLKGRGEVDQAPNAIQAAEMVLVRLAHAATLPTPEEAIKTLSTNAPPQAAAPPSQPGGPPPQGPPNPPVSAAAPAPLDPGEALTSPPREPEQAPSAPPEPLREAPARSDAAPEIVDFDGLVERVEDRKEGLLLTHLVNDVHPIAFGPGHMTFQPGPNAPEDLHGRIAKFLSAETGERWQVEPRPEGGGPTISEKRANALAEKRQSAADHPMVKAVMENFPGAELTDVREIKLKSDP